ncbi:MAG: exonuclease domain-containing protein, partial [Luteimonas sp.]
MSASLLFYDLETYGADPRRTRIAQFAAIRTDAELREIDAPIDVRVKPADDLLPSPIATLITGIVPQDALRDGVHEAEAFARINEEMARPETCTVGYNSLRFDDEFVRHGLFRNFHAPYEREWRGGNSRWDL